jgi:bifunctional enzyme CysN/CysC
MTSAVEIDAAGIAAFLDAQERKDLLRFITCGSVDDGKSTLIGRLLWDCKLIFEDQLATLESDSRRLGTQGDDIDFALLLDGLQAEREQGITIDVAYRFFATDRRRFIVADTPGHEQYTRNMATGASSAEAAVVLVDARKGILPQTRRHSFIVSLLGIRHVVLAVNKMDLVGYNQARFEAIRAEAEALAERLGLIEATSIPVSALKGDNVMTSAPTMPWYEGPTLLGWLETVTVADLARARPFRMPVQWVNRPDHAFRGFSGTVASGRIGRGDAVVVAESGKSSTVSRIVTFDGDLEEAVVSQAVTLVLDDEIDIHRGDMLASPEARPTCADQFQAHLVWMADEPLIPSRGYLLKIGTATANAQVTHIKYAINVNTMEHTAAPTLKLNEVGVANLSVNRPLAFDPYAENRDTGRFILIDRFTNATIGAGMIDFPLWRAANVHWQSFEVDKTARSAAKHQTACVLWFTGLSGSGKSTIANIVERKLHAMGRHTYTLDGDNVRRGLNRDLGFTEADRAENIRRVAEVARLMVDAGLIVLVSFISPYRAERRAARERIAPDPFLEIFVDAPLAVCEERDVKGLYGKARRGELANFTGIDSPYELPEAPDLILPSAELGAEVLAEQVIGVLLDRGVIRQQ